MKKQITFLPLLLLFLLLLGIGLVVYPIASSSYTEHHQSQVYTQYQESIEKAGNEEIEEARAAAEAYNRQLASGTIVEGEIPPDYDSLLNLTGNGMMGYIEIPAIDVLLPIYHGVGEDSLGKVNYFWGGKSLALGWDSRWGQLQLVWAEGSETTGTYRPYGLDCSGFVDWVFYNASGGAYVIGHGGGAYAQHTYCTDIPWSEAQPGDLAFYPEDEHVGIVGGWDASGNLLIIHCTSGSLNNVVITGSDGFDSIARPCYYIAGG